MKSVVVVGTNHDIQNGKSLKKDFELYLFDLCKKYDIQVIAEEINDDSNTIVAKSVSQNLGITHIIIDPNPTEYERLNIKEYHKIEYEVMSSSIDNKTLRIRDEHHHPRELEWLKRILEHNTFPVLVICGSYHFESFSNLLSSNRLNVISTVSNWGS